MKNKTYRNFYFISLAIIILLSAYPIYMGIQVASKYFANGFVLDIDYPKYVIPYTPMCIGIIASAIIIPLLYKLTKKWAQVISSAVGVVIFLVIEWLFEQIEIRMNVIKYPFGDIPLDSWQLSLCIATPEVLESIGKPTYADNNPAYKVHFYIIAILIIVCVVGILCGFTKMILENRREMKRPLVAQTVSVAVFIGLCILACFTAFYRNGTINISPLSAFLTGLFFVVFGVTFGVYIAGFLCRRSKWYSYVVPTVCASIMTVVMYIGELVLMGGKVFSFGTGIFFSPIGVCPLSLCDILIIVLSGVITAGIAHILSCGESENSVETE